MSLLCSLKAGAGAGAVTGLTSEHTDHQAEVNLTACFQQQSVSHADDFTFRLKMETEEREAVK